MVRIALLLLIASGLAIFTLQNLAPIALVILGSKTQVLPLAVWVIASLTAGALTTLFLSGLLSLGRSVSRSNQRDSFAARSAGSPWSTPGAKQNTQSTNRTAGFSATGANRRATDDWGTSPQADWDDWGESETASRSANQASTSRPDSRSDSRTQVRDTADDDWANWQGYEKSEPRDARRSDYANPPRPQQTEFESRQAPTSHQQSGSVYSYRYREPQDSAPRKPKEVYDAEYRVIIPPYNPTPEPSYNPSSEPPPYNPAPEPPASTPASTVDDDDEDWGLDDDLEDKNDRLR